jgi:hypothetical protein
MSVTPCGIINVCPLKMRAPGFKLRRTSGDDVDTRVVMDSNNVTTAETVLLRALVSVALATQLLAVIQITVLGVTLRSFNICL